MWTKKKLRELRLWTFTVLWSWIRIRKDWKLFALAEPDPKIITDLDLDPDLALDLNLM
jgi:hypothetical protein